MEESALSANWMVRTDGKAIPSRKLGKGSLIAKALGIDEGLGQEEASRQATAKLVNDKPTAAPVTKLAGQDDAPAVKTEAKVQDGTPSDVL